MVTHLCEKEKGQTTEGRGSSVQSVTCLSKRMHEDPELSPRIHIRRQGSVTHTCHSSISQAQTDKQIPGIHWPDGLAYLASSKLISKRMVLEK